MTQTEHRVVGEDLAGPLFGWQLEDVFRAMCGCASKSGIVCRSQPRIAARAGVDQRTVVRAQRELCALGFLRRMAKRRHTIQYQIVRDHQPDEMGR